VHPVYRRRCERDGLELTSAWLGAADLEADRGGPPELEQPTDIQPRPLDPNDQDDRIRAILGTAGDDPLPEATDSTLRQYHQFLTAHLKLPVAVEFAPENDFLPPNTLPLTLEELPPPTDGKIGWGLLAVARQGERRLEVPLSDLEAAHRGPAWQLLADYAYWFTNFGINSFPIGPPAEINEGDAAAAQGRRTVLNAISRCGLYGAAVGAAVGALIATETASVLFAMGVGAVTAAVVGYVAGTRYGFFFGKVNRINSGPILGGIFGFIGGAGAGAIAGALVIGYMGTILGSILGALVGQGLQFLSKRLPGPILCGFTGTVVGAIVWAWTLDVDRTLTGLLYGIAAGAAAGLLLSAGFFGTLLLIEMNRDEP